MNVIDFMNGGFSYRLDISLSNNNEGRGEVFE